MQTLQIMKTVVKTPEYPELQIGDWFFDDLWIDHASIDLGQVGGDAYYDGLQAFEAGNVVFLGENCWCQALPAYEAERKEKGDE